MFAGWVARLARLGVSDSRARQQTLDALLAPTVYWWAQRASQRVRERAAADADESAAADPELVRRRLFEEEEEEEDEDGAPSLKLPLSIRSKNSQRMRRMPLLAWIWRPPT